MPWVLLLTGIVAGGIVLARPGFFRKPEGFAGSTLLGFLLLGIGMTSMEG